MKFVLRVTSAVDQRWRGFLLHSDAGSIVIGAVHFEGTLTALLPRPSVHKCAIWTTHNEQEGTTYPIDPVPSIALPNVVTNEQNVRIYADSVFSIKFGKSPPHVEEELPIVGAAGWFGVAQRLAKGRDSVRILAMGFGEKPLKLEGPIMYAATTIEYGRILSPSR